MCRKMLMKSTPEEVRQNFKDVNENVIKLPSVILLRGTWDFFSLFSGTRTVKGWEPLVYSYLRCVSWFYSNQNNVKIWLLSLNTL